VDDGKGLLGSPEVAVDEQDASALAGEQDRGGLASANAGATGTGAGDNSDFILEAGSAGWKECHGNLRELGRWMSEAGFSVFKGLAGL
jgi:hypothetical protein